MWSLHPISIVFHPTTLHLDLHCIPCSGHLLLLLLAKVLHAYLHVALKSIIDTFPKCKRAHTDRTLSSYDQEEEEGVHVDDSVDVFEDPMDNKTGDNENESPNR